TVEELADVGWFSPVTAVDGSPKPATPRLSGFPNPTSNGASLVYTLPRAEDGVELGVYDTGGRLVARLAVGHADVGRHVVHWDGRDLAGRAVAAGVYHYRLKTPTLADGNTVVVVR